MEPPGPSEIREDVVTGRKGGIVVRVDIISHDDTHATVIIADSGVHVRQGQQYTVPIGALRHVSDYSD